jgi:hypothetical protein
MAFDKVLNSDPVWNLRVNDTLSFYDRRSYASRNFTSRVTEIADDYLRLADDIPASVQPYDLVINLQLFPQSVTIVNSTFGNNRGRGALLQVSHVHVSNCTFHNITGAGILVGTMCVSQWCESHVIERNWTIADNRFLDTVMWKEWGPGTIHIAARVNMWENGEPSDDTVVPTDGIQHYNMTVQRNHFVNSFRNDEPAFVGYGIQGLWLDSNTGSDLFHISNNSRQVTIITTSPSMITTSLPYSSIAPTDPPSPVNTPGPTSGSFASLAHAQSKYLGLCLIGLCYYLSRWR